MHDLIHIGEGPRVVKKDSVELTRWGQLAGYLWWLYIEPVVRHCVMLIEVVMVLSEGVDPLSEFCRGPLGERSGIAVPPIINETRVLILKSLSTF